MTKVSAIGVSAFLFCLLGTSEAADEVKKTEIALIENRHTSWNISLIDEFNFPELNFKRHRLEQEIKNLENEVATGEGELRDVQFGERRYLHRISQ